MKDAPRPRPYLTWSQLNTFEQDPEEYRRQFILGEPFVSNEYIDFGKRFAEELEAKKGVLYEYASIWFPDYPMREYGISAKCDICPLYGKYDAFDPTGRIGEYKTGKRWDQHRVDQDGQLTFYAYIYYLKFKSLPKQIALHWAETTRDEQGNICLSGKMQTFYATRKTEDFLRMYTRIKCAWDGIAVLAAEEWDKVL